MLEYFINGFQVLMNKFFLMIKAAFVPSLIVLGISICVILIYVVYEKKRYERMKPRCTANVMGKIRKEHMGEYIVSKYIGNEKVETSMPRIKGFKIGDEVEICYNPYNLNEGYVVGYEHEFGFMFFLDHVLMCMTMFIMIVLFFFANI